MPATQRTIVTLLVMVSAIPALATPPTPEPSKVAKKSAAELFRRGQALYAKGRFEEAVKAFSEAHRLAPHRSAIFNVARCHENLGRLNEALVAYRETLALSKSPAHRAEVQERLDLLSRRPTKVFVASDPAGATVTIDGRAQPEARPTPAVLSLRPGPHVLLLRKEGHQLAAKRVVVALGKEQTVTVKLERLVVPGPCPTKRCVAETQVVAPPPLVQVEGVHVHIGLMTPIVGSTDRKAEAGPGIQLHITVGRFLFGAHLLMNFQSEQPYSGDVSVGAERVVRQSFRRLLPELEGGWVFPYRNLYFYTTLGLGFHIDRPIFILDSGADLVREWFAFAWSAGGGVEIFANRWISLGAALRLGMAHGDRANKDEPEQADDKHHFPWTAFWAGVTVHL